MSVGKLLDQYVEEQVDAVLKESKFPDYDDIYTDTLAEIIDKMIIAHIRQWYLEDAIQQAQSDEERMALRKKIQVLFKEKRPMLVAAFDKLIVNILTGKVNYSSQNLKNYKGWVDKENKE